MAALAFFALWAVVKTFVNEVWLRTPPDPIPFEVGPTVQETRDAGIAEPLGGVKAGAMARTAILIDLAGPRSFIFVSRMVNGDPWVTELTSFTMNPAEGGICTVT
jgi:hypothetical protein